MPPMARPYDRSRKKEIIVLVKSGRLSSAEMTAAIVSRAVQTGASLCIPGAREVRVGRPASPTSVATGGTPPTETDERAVTPERRESELAGGGAPSERGIIRRANAIERLYDLLRRGSGRHHDTPREAPLPRPNRIEST